MSDHLDEIKNAVIQGRHKKIEDLVKAAIEGKVSINEIVNDALIAAMDVVGQKFADKGIFVPEMLVSAITMKKGLDLIKPLLKGKETESRGTIIMCTVKGDIHDIGKNLVCMMMGGAGFEVVDLGINTPVEDYLAALEEHKPEILGMSALLTTTMPEMRKVIDALSDKGLRNHVKVIVGGAPVNDKFARDIGADGYAQDAGESVELAKRLLQ